MRVKSNIDDKQLNIIGERLRAIRADHALTQEELAEALGVQRETVGQWERGVTPPSLSSLLKICDLYHVDLDYICGRLDCQTHDLQYVHELTGLSEDAIKKIINLNRENITPSNADILSALIEHMDTEFILTLIGHRLTAPTPPTPKDYNHMTPQQLVDEANRQHMPVSMDGMTIWTNKTTFIDSQISATIIRDLPGVAQIYHQHLDNKQ